ncbi:MAG: hypothetical protein QGI45_03550 [Myxococcota bacterium]|jgi:hypothetical protein|nr:hypothetical protein [Myxococcota bacterium]
MQQLLRTVSIVFVGFALLLTGCGDEAGTGSDFERVDESSMDFSRQGLEVEAARYCQNPENLQQGLVFLTLSGTQNVLSFAVNSAVKQEDTSKMFVEYTHEGEKSYLLRSGTLSTQLIEAKEMASALVVHFEESVLGFDAPVGAEATTWFIEDFSVVIEPEHCTPESVSELHDYMQEMQLIAN